MTEKETINWMIEKGYKKMWILPKMDLFARNPVLKFYRGRPPGNIPEICNRDSCLNKDLHKAVDFYVRYTHLLHKLDPKKFSIATPKKRTSAYLRIFGPIDGVYPSSERIISNTYDVLTPINYIVEAEGYIIPDTKNVKNTQKGQLRESWGVRTLIMGERE